MNVTTLILFSIYIIPSYDSRRDLRPAKQAT